MSIKNCSEMDEDEVVLVSSDSSGTTSPVSQKRENVSEVISSICTHIGEASSTSNEKLNVTPCKKVYHTLSESDSDGADNGNLCKQSIMDEAVLSEKAKKVIQDSHPKGKRKKMRHIPKEDVLKKKEEERKRKEEKRQQLLIEKSLKPGECLKHVTVLLDSSLLQFPFGGKLLATVQSTESPSRIVSNLVPFTICWERSFPNLESTEESQVLLIWHYNELISAVVEGELCERLCDIKNILQNKDIILLVYGLQEYFRKQKRSTEQKFNWYAALDSRDCVRVDKNGNGLLRLWQQQLTQFNLASIDKAQAIVAKYPSPQLLKQAYENCASETEAEFLLQTISVRRTQGPLSSFRRIGPELSKKIYRFLNRTEGDYEL